MSDYGLKVSEIGVDVKTATDVQLVFSSELSTLKIAVEGQTSSTANGRRDIEITHNFGYIPGYITYWDVDSNAKFINGDTYLETVTGSKQASVWAWVDDTKLYLQLDSEESCAIRIYYLLLADAAD